MRFSNFDKLIHFFDFDKLIMSLNAYVTRILEVLYGSINSQ